MMRLNSATLLRGRESSTELECTLDQN